MTTDSTLQLTPQLAPQFDTANLDLNFKKGESAQFSVTVVDYNLDLRGCLIFAEIRRTTPGYELIDNFTGVATSGNPVIQIKRYPYTDDKAQILRSLPVRLGDLITLEGSGITGSKVIAVTDSQIIATGSATRTISEGRLSVRSLSPTSFTAIPITAVGSVVTSAVSNGTVGTVSISPATVPAGNKLVFANTTTANNVTTIAPVVVTLSQNLLVGGTQINSGTTFSLSTNAEAKVGAQTIVTREAANSEATGILVFPLSMGIESGAVLNFAVRSIDGWQYVGAATVSSSVLHGSNSIPVQALGFAIPKNAIAWHGNVPFNSFYLAIDPIDTQFLESGSYRYDVICRQANGYTIRLIQGKISLSDHWSDL
jgi:hypothetical protein